MLAALLAVVLISVTLNVLSYTIMTFTLLTLLTALRPTAKQLRQVILPLLIMMFLTFLLHLLFNHTGKTVIAHIAGFPVRQEAVEAGFFFSWRVGLFFLAALCFARLVPADDFAAAIWRLLAPLNRLSVPVNQIGMAVLLAIRFIPTTIEQYHQIVFAQRARGASFDGGLIARVRKIVPLLVPVTAATIRKSDTLADALVVRGWGVSKQRTFYSHSRMGWRDYLAFVIIVVWGGIVVGVGL